jgi:hypothetical protein
MATIGNTALTFTDWAKRYDDGRVAAIIELLGQSNEILDDMRWMEGNLPTGHKTTVRTGLPEATWRLLNYGVQPTKSTTAQITDACGMLETYSEIDKALADLNGNTAAFRLSEDSAFLEAMNQQMARALFYGNQETDPEHITGFAPRFNSRVVTDTNQAGENIVEGGGVASANTSVWLIVWGDATVHGIFPKGSKAGLQHRDLGEQTLLDAQGGRYQGYRTHYKWDAGLTVRDWRYCVRIANIDVNALESATPPDLVELMIRAIERVPNLGAGTPVFYASRKVKTWLRIQELKATNAHIRPNEIAGKKVTEFDGVPVRTCDQLLDTEARIV